MEVDVHIHGRPHPEETESGDAAGVHAYEGITWVLVLDALGHGPEAAKVGVLALAELRTFGAEPNIELAFARLNDACEGSRGAAAALLRFEIGRISVIGIGNVELRTLAGVSLPYIPGKGILGRRLPASLRGRDVIPTEPGRVLLYTDGIERRAPIHVLARQLTGAGLCKALVVQHALDRDDALVAHVDYWP